MSEPELTKREFAAIQIMAGIWSNQEIHGTFAELAGYAIKQTDELLKQLQETDQ